MPPVVDATSLEVPPGSRVIHIGPPKTGTTALQGALWLARDSLAAQGVRYPGKSRHPVRPMFAVTGRRPPGATEPPPITAWTEFCSDVAREPTARVMISSEGFAYARDDAIARVVHDLDPGRVHVLVTLRPLGRLLASEWQQQVQGGMALSLEAWLRDLFDRPEAAHAVSFWYRHRHDHLVQRWASVVGPDRVTVLVVDDVDRHRLYRDVELLLGLRARTLVPAASLPNRSLTLEEVSVIRALQAQFVAEGRDRREFDRLIRVRAGPHLKARVPGPGEHRIETPRWALERATAVGREMVPAIAAAGVRWWGDLDRLAEPAPADAPEVVDTDGAVPAVVAAAVAMAFAQAGGVLDAVDGNASAGPAGRSRSRVGRVTRLGGRLGRALGRS